MKETNDAQIRNLLKKALHQENEELQRDLWPQMLQRLDEGSSARTVPWFDWALLALLLMCTLAFPQSILMLFYHL
jgi:hypothetical protein